MLTFKFWFIHSFFRGSKINVYKSLEHVAFMASADITVTSIVIISISWYKHKFCGNKVYNFVEYIRRDASSNGFMSLCSWRSSRKTLRPKDMTDKGWAMKNSAVSQKLHLYSKNKRDTGIRYSHDMSLEPVKLVQLSLVPRPRPTFHLLHFRSCTGRTWERGLAGPFSVIKPHSTLCLI